MKLNKHIYAIIFLIAFAFLLRIPGVPWGIVNYDGFHVDEAEFVSTAKRLIDKFDDGLIEDSDFHPVNSRGYSTQLAIISYLPLKILNLDPNFIYLFGRLFTLFYSILLVLLVYYIAFYLTKSKKIAFLAGLLLSIFDMNVTYSHYSTPHIPHVFWVYAAIFSIFFFVKNIIKNPKSKIKNWLLFLIPLPVALSMSFRFDTLPLFILYGSLLFLFIKKKFKFRELLYYASFFGILILGFFYISVGFDFNLTDFEIAKERLLKDNKDGVPEDNGLINNPTLNFMAIFSGTSFLIFIIFFISLFYAFNKENNNDFKIFNILILIHLSLSFILFWTGDATYVRRMSIFLPFMALISGYGLIRFLDSKKLKFIQINLRKIIIIIVVLYTLGLTINSQYYFVFDTRYDASAYLNEKYQENYLISYSPYGKTRSMPDGLHLNDFNEDVEILVLHETYYGRYWRYSANLPLKKPRCCQEVFHCVYGHCILIQDLLSDKGDYKLVKKFQVKNYFPERVLYKYLYGTFETFLGDVLIFEKRVQ